MLKILSPATNWGSAKFLDTLVESSIIHSKIETLFTGSRLLCLILGICSTGIHHVFTAKPNFDVVYQWNQLEYDYHSEYDRQADIDTGNFIPGKAAPIDVEVYYSNNKSRNKIFVTVPRFLPGVPITLGTVSGKMYKGSPVISPYPSWEWHRSPHSCGVERIVSVFRVAIDECNRLWVLDTGKVLETQTCPAQILAFDLKTDRLLYSSDIPSDLLESRSLLVTPVVDIRDGQCDNAFIYMADVQTYSIIVHDVKNREFWKATDKTMYPYPNYGTYTIKGESFDLMDGILGMALSPHVPGRDRKLYYHAMSSATENWVNTMDLRNKSRFENDPESSPEVFHHVWFKIQIGSLESDTIGSSEMSLKACTSFKDLPGFGTYRGQRRTQSAAEAMDNDGIMFFGLMSDIKIACWNTRGEYADPSSTDTVAYNPLTLQFASGVKVRENNKRAQEVWIMTSRFQKVSAETLTSSEVNFRILAGKVDDLLFGTNCRGKKMDNNIAITHHPQGGGAQYGRRHRRSASGDF
ncbi:hypothetical protein NQ317_012537, partial [Molorchus minor]